MAYDWGKYINGKVFIEDPIVINNGNIISTEILKTKRTSISSKLNMRIFLG